MKTLESQKSAAQAILSLKKARRPICRSFSFSVCSPAKKTRSSLPSTYGPRLASLRSFPKWAALQTSHCSGAPQRLDTSSEQSQRPRGRAANPSAVRTEDIPR